MPTFLSIYFFKKYFIADKIITKKYLNKFQPIMDMQSMLQKKHLKEKNKYEFFSS